MHNDPNFTQPAVKSAAPLAPYKLRVEFDNRVIAEIDLKAHIRSGPEVFGPLLEHPEMWSRAQLGEYGGDIRRSDDMAVPDDVLWFLYRRQNGLLTEDELQYIKHVEESIRQADAGIFATDDEVREAFSRAGVDITKL